jgi:hypothetical protein
MTIHKSIYNFTNFNNSSILGNTKEKGVVCKHVERHYGGAVIIGRKESLFARHGFKGI